MPPPYYRAVFLLLSRNSALSRSSKSTAGIKVPSWYQTVCGSWRLYIYHYAIPRPLSSVLKILHALPMHSSFPPKSWRPPTSLLCIVLPFQCHTAATKSYTIFSGWFLLSLNYVHLSCSIWCFDIHTEVMILKETIIGLQPFLFSLSLKRNWNLFSWQISNELAINYNQHCTSGF